MDSKAHKPVKLKKAKAPLVLAIDIGTSSSRAIVYDAMARPVKGLIQQIGHQMETTDDGGVFMDADVIVKNTARCIDGILNDAGKRAKDIKGVGCDTFWHSMMGVDARGKPTSKIINWADTRPRSAIPMLRKKLDEKQVHRRTGCVLHSSYLPAKLLWFQKEQKSAFKRTKTWMSIGEYLYFCFFGKTICSTSMASGTGLFNQNRAKWDDGMFSVLPVDENSFPELGCFDTPLTGLAKGYAKRWPALKNVPWFAAIGDGASSNVGCGCVRDNELAMVVGTSGAMRVLIEKPRTVIPDGLWVYRVDKKRFVKGGALSDGGNLRKWVGRVMAVGGKKEIDAALTSTKPDAHGLTVLPFWAGERSTGWNPNARGLIDGLVLNTSQQEIARASIEGISYRFAEIFEIFKKSKTNIRKIIASGGGLIDSAVVTQLVADSIGHSITQSGEAEGSARGVAVLVLEALGTISHISKAPVPLGKTFRPSAANHRVYRDARLRQNKLYDIISTRWWPAR